jgi:exodeoxyribonuclease III
VRIATWNVNSVAARLPRVTEWLAGARPDVLCLQETKISGERFPRSEVEALGYEVAAYGTGGRNGVAILSRAGLEDVVYGFAGEPGFPELEPRSVAATCGKVRVWSVYVPNGREIGVPAFEYKMRWLAALREVLAGEARQHQLAVCGDFNVAPTDDDVWDPKVFVGSTHVTPEERAAITDLLDLGLVDLQPRALKGKPFSYWDYRAGNFHEGRGMRIDLTLLSQSLAEHVSDVYIDRDARKGKLPSDHAPVVVDIQD